jgi:phosphoserine aminotransferase
MTAAPAMTSCTRPTPSGRVYNFSAGPAGMPEPVLRQLQEDLWDLRGSGIGIMEHSHRGAIYDAINAEAHEWCRKAGRVPADWEVILMPGGATVQQAYLPFNFLPAGRTADYPDTGIWTTKAISEGRKAAAMLGAHIHVAFEGSRLKYTRVPKDGEMSQTPNAAYLHYCSNNTVFGTRYPTTPVTTAPLVCDASSEYFARPVDWDRHVMLYGGGQKNLGPSGISLVLVKKEFLATANPALPTMMSFAAHAAGESRLNTPPTFGVHAMGLMFRWIAAQGGPEALERAAIDKSGLLYDAIDSSNGFYTGLAERWCRSFMNVSFRLPTPELDARFVKEAAAHGMDGLTGHRDAGGIRASIYSAFPREGCVALAQFMRDFAGRNS